MSRVDFQLTPEQRDLRAAVRALLAGRFGRERLRQAVDGEHPAVDRELWSELAEAGFFSLRLPESAGGAGLGMAEAVLAFEEAGRSLLPGPLVATHLAAGLVAGAADGTAVVAVADAASRPVLAEHLDAADALLILGRDDGRRALCADPAVCRAEPVRAVDPLSPLSRVLGFPARGRPLAAASAQLRRSAALLVAAQQSGIAARTVELAVAHAGSREQFGQPIGGFQAVKHICADMLVRAEVARAAVYAAAVTETPPDVAAAKLLADDAAVRNSRDCLQIHGGMGFTWDIDVHLFLKRAWLHSTRFADATENEEALAAEM